jgi:hypothetical protein
VEWAKNAADSYQRNKLVASYFKDPGTPRSDKTSNIPKKPVIISMNDNEKQPGVKSLCIFEQVDPERGRLKGKGLLQNSRLEGQAISIPIYTSRGIVNL